MKRQANGIGNYNRKRPMQYAPPMSEERRARMDEADRICRERAAAYRAQAAGVPAQKIEAAA